MDRREFIKALFAGGAGLIFNKALAQQFKSPLRSGRALPPPQVNTFSSEIVLNSRLSYHSGYSGALTDQILANVLWAASRAPLIGGSRIIYVARTDNVYRYDPNQHDIILHQPGNHLSESNLAFEVGVAADLIEDAGTALQYAHLASISFWTTSSNQPSCCPKESARNNANSTWNPASSIHLVNCYGLRGTVNGITNELVAQSSNGSLPDPSTNGAVLLENGLANLKYGDQYQGTELDLNQISQLAWASYGCNPHYTSNGRAGLTAASAVANYYLTGRIYIVRSVGVERYHIRLPSGQPNTRDHRIERVTNGDRRAQLRSAIPRLPQTAPNYIVYCATTADRWQTLETGFCGAGALLQATSIDLQGYFTADFTSQERTAIINALSIPSGDLPLFIFSAGLPLVGVEERSGGGLMYHNASPNPFSTRTQIKYGLATTTKVRLAIYDSSGRLIRVLVNRKQSKGQFAATWDGTDQKGRNLPAGAYHYILKVGDREYTRKVVKIR